MTLNVLKSKVVFTRNTDVMILLSILLILELYGLILEMRTAIIYDWLVVLAPFVWINFSALYLYYLFRELTTSRSSQAPVGRRWYIYFRPDFTNLRRVIRNRRVKLMWFFFSSAYFLLYSYLQGVLAINPSGGMETRFLIVYGSVGYGPAVVWVPIEYFGIVMRPYLTLAALAISISSGLIITLFILLLLGKRRVLNMFPASLMGFTVLCPTCLTSPVSAFLIAFTAGLASTAGFAFSSLFAAVLAVSTILLVVSLILIWMSISVLSKVPVSGGV